MPRALPRLGSTVPRLAAMHAVAALCGCGGGGPVPDPAEAYPGGDTTNFHALGIHAFTLPLANLEGDRLDDFFSGNSFFNDVWVTAPSSTTARDGLGPTFNAASCSDCHFRDGRGRPPLDADEPMLSMLVRISVPGTDAHGGPLGDANYGGQIQPRGVLGVPGEASVEIAWVEETGAYADGEAYSLRRPVYTFQDLAFGPLDPALLHSGRVAPAVFGLGLLEAIDESTVLAWVDAHDADGDGISGRPNYVWDVEAGAAALGRFGWKAAQPSVRQQSAGAFLGDLGITSELFPESNCPSVQLDCLAAPNGGDPELTPDRLDRITYYGRTLGVPTRERWDDPMVMAGRDLVRELGCTSCHRETVRTGVLADFPELSEQDIRPFTDLLLHDMGEGLADGRPEYEATGSEWRTPPLWGVGRVSEVNGHSLLLHDGRARGFAEAILWHGGEAEEARELFRALPRDDREAVIAFLESL